MTQYDVLVVGTRCGGAPLCMLLARRGIEVLGIDRAHFPSDTISTHFLWPRTTSLLAKWGLLDELAATGCPPIRRVTVDYGPVAISGRPSAVEGTASMFSPRRIVLDQLLVAAARRAGAEMRDEVTCRGLGEPAKPSESSPRIVSHVMKHWNSRETNIKFKGLGDLRQ